MRERKGIGGRPREGRNVKTAPLSIRTDPALKARIEQLADREGLSFTQAVERLLKRGLDAAA